MIQTEQERMELRSGQTDAEERTVGSQMTVQVGYFVDRDRTALLVLWIVDVRGDTEGCDVQNQEIPDCWDERIYVLWIAETLESEDQNRDMDMSKCDMDRPDQESGC